MIQERDETNTPTVSYTRGNDPSGSLEGAGGIGGLLARSSGYSAGQWTTNHFYHADANGNDNDYGASFDKGMRDCMEKEGFKGVPQ